MDNKFNPLTPTVLEFYIVNMVAVLPSTLYIFKHFLKLLFILFLESGKDGEKMRNINVWFTLACPLLGTWPTTQACALTGNRTSDPLFCSPALNPLSHTHQPGWNHPCF